MEPTAYDTGAPNRTSTLAPMPRHRRLVPLAVLLVAAACSPKPPQGATTTTGPAAASTTVAATIATAVIPTTTLGPVEPPTTAPPPPSEETAEPVRERLVIHAAGDLNFTTTMHREFDRQGFDIAFSGLDGIFQRDDLTIVNLECDPSEIGSLLSSKPFSFRCDLRSLPAMVRGGVDVAVMANNHSADFGFDSLIDGRGNLETAGLDPVGAGADLAEANQPRIYEIGGWRIGVVAFSGVSGLGYNGTYPKTVDLVNPWFADEDSPGVAPASEANMTAVVSALDPLVDFVIVSLHQGEVAPDSPGHPDALERERIRWLVEAGADAVVAHHHHWLLPFEYFQGVPIFWGMGNFVWQSLGRHHDTTAVAELVIESDGTITGRLIPAYIESSGHPVLRGLPDPAVRSNRQQLGD